MYLIYPLPYSRNPKSELFRRYSDIRAHTSRYETIKREMRKNNLPGHGTLRLCDQSIENPGTYIYIYIIYRWWIIEACTARNPEHKVQNFGGFITVISQRSRKIFGCLTFLALGELCAFTEALIACSAGLPFGFLRECHAFTGAYACMR